MGVYGHPEAANLVYLGLYAQQHRGQEGSGIVSADEGMLLSHRGLGWSPTSSTTKPSFA